MKPDLWETEKSKAISKIWNITQIGQFTLRPRKLKIFFRKWAQNGSFPQLRRQQDLLARQVSIFSMVSKTELASTGNQVLFFNLLYNLEKVGA